MGIATALCLSLASTIAAAGHAGATVDTGFGANGKIQQDDVDNLTVVARPNGNVLSVGVLPFTSKSFSVSEHTATGAPVSSFGANGAAQLLIPGADGTADDINRIFEVKGAAVAADGGLVVHFSTSVGAALAKITPAGALDPSFGGGDGWLTDWYVQCGLTTDLSIGADGAIYTVSHDLQGNAAKPACPGTGTRKYSANGTKVDNWGGAALNLEGGRQDGRIEAAAMTVATVGGAERVVTSGVVPGNNTASAGVQLLDPDGNAVAGFGTDGLVTFDPSPGVAVDYWGGISGFARMYENKTAIDVAVDGAGHIVVLGSSARTTGGDVDVWVARLTPTGQLDTGFGAGGIAWTDVGGHQFDYALSLAVDGHDRPVIVGSTSSAAAGTTPDTRAQFTVRLTTTGAVDPSTAPTVTTFGSGLPHIPHSMALVGDGRVYSAGGAVDQYGLFRGYLGSTTLPVLSPTGSSELFNGISPVRALDTRAAGSPLAAGAPRSVTVTGIGAVPISGVSAVAINVTVEAPTTGGYLTVWPSGSTMPLASSLNYAAGQTIANSLVVGVGPDGRIDLGLGDGQASVIVDVMGYLGEGQGFTAVTPVRAIDTRANGGTLVVQPNTTVEVPVTALGAIPAGGVSAVALNLTAVDPVAGGHLRAWPTGGDTPWASVLNFAPGQTVANAMVLGVGANGSVTIANYSDGPVHIVVDVAGWFADSSAFHAITPARALDTRSTNGFGTAEQRTLHVAGVGGVPASGVRAVVVNVTVTEPTNPTFVSIWPGGTALPPTSAVNAGAGQTLANALIVGVDANGDVDLFNAVGDAQVIVDVLGYF